ncbi:MAG: class I SAM-dependent methyltransferase [Candidatus Paceibacterota bacterium]|jgi:2-polyprenyl-3-methyl-5-hydroxy-6-metoxy-1,4-benzoquinol methylase
MNKIKKFWDNRVDKYGHTGWSDSSIYAYDQQARLMAVEKILQLMALNGSIALDFGTGVGDFADLLSRYFNKVVAFDVSESVIVKAKKRYGRVKNIQFFSGGSIENVPVSNKALDLVLSVTVLDHIIDDSELARTIKHFQGILKDNGTLIIFEYALDHKKQKTQYQRFMELEEWRSMFLESGFSLNKYYNFYHPIEHPCDSYLSYRNSFLVKALNMFSKYTASHLASGYLNELARRYLKGKRDFLIEDNKESSPIKIMIFKRNC